MLDLLLLAALAAPQGPAPVVINELTYDDSGTDDREFVELFNTTTAAIDISGWYVQAADAGGVKATYTVPANTSLPAGAFYVMGTALVPNVNQIIGTQDLFENDQEAVTLYDKNNKIIDTLVYEANKVQPIWNPALVEGPGLWGNFTSVDSSLNVGETTWQRMTDGRDTNNNGLDFRIAPSSPGKSNNFAPRPIYLNTFDTGTVDTAVADFGGSFRYPHYIDPTQTGRFNAKVRKASPQGGLAMAAWDESGGGNSAMFISAPLQDVIVECYAYFDATLEATGLNETWSLGVQGTTGTYYNTPDPARSFGFTANGNTGVSWTFQVTDKDAILYLIDHNDGGTDYTVLGSIKLTAGINDGWQRLRLEVSGNHAQGFFGGTYGGGDGQQLFGTVAQPNAGSVYLGYREFVLSRGDDPPILDFLTIKPGLGRLQTIGTAKGTTKGIPELSVNGFPKVGWSGFTVSAKGLVPNQATLLFLAGTLLNPPLDLQLLGGQAGSNLYLLPALTFTPSSNGQGEASLNLPVPNDAGFSGLSVYWQNIDFDAALPVLLKVGNSAAVETRVTN